MTDFMRNKQSVIPNLIWNLPRMLWLFQKQLQALQALKILNQVQDDFIILINNLFVVQNSTELRA